MGSNFNISRDFIFYPIHKLNYHMEKIKLIWDFRGPACSHTATHFKTHLIEFFESEKLELILSGIEVVNEFHHYTYAVIDKKNLEGIKSSLKPNRGQFFETSK